MKYIESFDELFLNEDLSKASSNTFMKMSVYTLMHLMAWLDMRHHEKVKEADGTLKYRWNFLDEKNTTWQKVLLEEFNEEMMKFAIKYEEFFRKNFTIIAANGELKEGLTLKSVEKELKKYKIYYVFRDPTIPRPSKNQKFYVLMGSNFTNLKTMRNDGYYDPSSGMHGDQRIEKIDFDKAEDFLVSADLGSQAMIDRVWDKRVEKDPSKIKQAEKHISDKIKKKWKHLGSDFGLFDD